MRTAQALPNGVHAIPNLGFFRFVPQPTDEEHGQVFRRAFADVWSGVPAADRERLRDYWATTRRHACADEVDAGSYPKPLIQLVASNFHLVQACDRAGAELNFSVDQAEDS